VSATLAPHSASNWAKRLPKPDVAPVTRATCPVKSIEKFGFTMLDIFSHIQLLIKIYTVLTVFS